MPISYADNLKISFVDMDKIIATSTAGKKIQKSINNLIKKQEEKFKKTEENLKKKEEEILKQKNIISKEELDKKIKNFQVSLSDFRNERTSFNRTITKTLTNKAVNTTLPSLASFTLTASLALTAFWTTPVTFEEANIFII